MTRRWSALVVVALLGAAMAACSDDGPGEGEARLEVDGEATVERANGDRDTVDGGTDLSRGDRVTMVDGVAVMHLKGGTTYELREGFGTAADSAVLMANRPVLEAGDLLVSAPDTARLEADGTEIDVAEGAARITRAFGMSVSAYDADVHLDSAGVEAAVPALRRMAVPDLGRPPRDARPVDYDDADTDPWDLRYLGAGIALDKELTALADHFTGLLPDGEGRTVGFLRLVLPGLDGEAELDQGDIDTDRAPGDTLIGAAISDLGERGSFSERWAEVFDFHDDGAAWGIVALDQAVKAAPLVGSVEEAFNSSFDEVVLGSDTSTGGSTTPGASDGGTDGDRSGTGGTDGGTGGGTDGGSDGSSTPTTVPVTPPVTTPPILPPLTPPTAPPPPDLLEPVVDPVTDLLDDLVGGLLP